MGIVNIKNRITGKIIKTYDTDCMEDHIFYDENFNFADFSNQDLTSFNFIRCSFVGSTFKDSILNYGLFRWCLIDQTDFSLCELNKTIFCQVSLINCSFMNSSLIKVKFIESKLIMADLSNSFFRRCSFAGVDLVRGVNFID
ncbi:MAG: pentapeptide repeat-containing protein [Pseudomonadota bacterium]